MKTFFLGIKKAINFFSPISKIILVLALGTFAYFQAVVIPDMQHQIVSLNTGDNVKILGGGPQSGNNSLVKGEQDQKEPNQLSDTTFDTTQTDNSNSSSVNRNDPLGRLYFAFAKITNPSLSFENYTYISGDLIIKKDTLMLRVKPNAIDSEKIRWHAIEAEDIDTGSITSRIIKDGTIQGKDISENAELNVKELTVSDGLVSTGPLQGITLDTGQGAYELYAMDQNVLTTSSPTFAGITLNGNLILGANTLTTTNTTLVSNLNADLLDGQHGTYYLPTGNISGATNYISKFTGASSLGNSLIYDNGTNVGIGTTLPRGLVDFSGTNYSTWFEDALIPPSGINGWHMNKLVGAPHPDPGQSNGITFDVNGVSKWTTGMDYENVDYVLAYEVGIGDSFRVSPGGKFILGVGVGTPSGYPYNLTIMTGTSILDPLWLYSNYNGERKMRIQNISTGDNAISSSQLVMDSKYFTMSLYGDNHATRPNQARIFSNGGLGVPPNIVLGSYTTDQVFLNTTTGNVGIGTTNPQKKLEINDADSNTTTSGLRFTNFACTGNDKLTVGAGGDLICGTDQTGGGAGNVVDTLAATLGAANDANALDINNIGKLYAALGTVGVPAYSFQTDTDTGLWSSAANTLNFSTNGAERLRIESTGNVGIGTTSPDVVVKVRDNNMVGAMKIQSDSTAVLIAEKLDGTDIFKVDGTNTRVIITGNVGIGLTVPTALLHLNGSAGKVSLEINSNETTPGSNVLMLRSDVVSADDPIFRVQANGLVYADGAYTNPGADYAEYFYTEDSDLKSGEAVCVDTQNDNAVKRCQNSGDNNIMGIVSTKPSIIGNKNSNQENDPDHYKVIGMIGQVSGLISNENGNINIGDSLTSASLKGYLRKANAGESTVGVAMQDFSKSTGTIQILISRRNQSLTVEKVEEAVTQNIASMNIQDQVDNIVAKAKTNLDQQMASQTQDIASLQKLNIKLQEQIDDIKSAMYVERYDELWNFYLVFKPESLANVVFKESGNINLLEGKITAKDIEALGIVKAKGIEVEDIAASKSLKLGKEIRGTGEIKAGDTEIKIETVEASLGVQIYITPLGQLNGRSLYVDMENLEDGKSFSVKLDGEPLSKNLKFNWLIIQ